MFKNLFGKKSEKKEPKKDDFKIDWIPLSSVDQIAEIKEASVDSYVGVFKHSTRCVISRTVIQRFENEYPEGLNLKMCYIDLLNYREVSNAITDTFQVIHQSPQLIIIKDGKVVANASHHDIPQLDLTDIVK